MKMTKIKCFFVALTIAGLVSGCKKDQEITPAGKGKEASKTEDLILIEADINSADNDIEDADALSGKRVSQLCFNVSFSGDTANPVPGFETNYRKYVLTYSGGDCDSLQRSGEIIVYRSGRIITGNYKDSVIFNNYTTGGRSLTGYRSYKFISADLKDLIVSYSVNVQAKNANGNFVHVISEGQKKYVGYLISLFTSIETTGSTKVVDQNGDILNVAILEPVILKRLCSSRLRFPIQGVVSYTNSITNNKVVLNYGNGTCDRIATLTLNDSTRTIFLK